MFDIVDDMKPRVVRIDFPTLPLNDERASASRVNGRSSQFFVPQVLIFVSDLFLANLINILPSPNYTVIYTTTPPSAKHHLHDEVPSTYHMDTSMSPLVHMEMKRDNSKGGRNSANNVTLVDGPLFEKYQYFTPGMTAWTWLYVTSANFTGIFMALFVGIILLMILYVGISALGSLEVSYAAFDKDMGPAAQKKQ
jgi:hypothetical protein